MFLVHRLPPTSISLAINPIEKLVVKLLAGTKAASTRLKETDHLLVLLEGIKPWNISAEVGKIQNDGLTDKKYSYRFDNEFFEILKADGPSTADWDYPLRLSYLCFERANGLTIAFVDPDGRLSYFLTPAELEGISKIIAIEKNQILTFSDFVNNESDLHGDFYVRAIINEYIAARID